MSTRRLKPWEFTDPACAESSLSVFYSPDPDDPDVVSHVGDYQAAKKICAKCVHQLDCAAWGLDNETHGVWGGLDPDERRKANRRMSRQRAKNRAYQQDLLQVE